MAVTPDNVEGLGALNLQALAQALSGTPGDLPADASRLFHGRGHCYGPLNFINVDWFEPVLWVVIYGEVEETLTAAISGILKELAAASPAVQCVSLQRRHRGQARQDVVYGEMPGACYARENGARFELNLGANQNIGFFLDARPGREWLAQRAGGKRVLNLFAYTCAFSVAAMHGGAAGVVNIDMAKSALAAGQRNHALNGIDSGELHFLPYDVFRSTRKLEDLGPYDLVVIDPPSRPKGSFEADRDYARLLQRLRPMLAQEVEVLACLNAPYLDGQFLPELFSQCLPELTYLQRLLQREDFPERDLDRCLKMQVFGRGETSMSV
jgi:23S rRNA (cytosine1962-C5)-methyltransferase